MNEILLQLIADHDQILVFIADLEKDLLTFMNSDKIDIAKMRNQITFIREFADGTHHMREEKVLFKYMVENLGSVADNLIRHGMLVEHDYGRFNVLNWENHLNSYQQRANDIDKLQILTYAQSYCNLLRRHIEKENNVVFPFAQRSLSAEIFAQMASDEAK